MSISLFLDSNIWLSFYEFTDDTLDELTKLKDRIATESIELLVPQQVVDEVKRNRETTLHRSIKVVRDAKLPGRGLPRVVQHQSAVDALMQAAMDYESRRQDIESVLRAEAKADQLPADLTIKALFEVANVVPTSKSVLERAELRKSLGNPPGKGGTLGDQIIWETMLETLSSFQDLHIVARDSDFRSMLDDTAADPFLVDEWFREKSAALHYYARLQQFARANADDLDIASLDELLLADEPEASPEVLALAESTNFQMTHTAIVSLNAVDQLSAGDLRQLVWAAENNSQVRWILGDPDVHEFYGRIVKVYGERLSPTDLATLGQLLLSAEPSGE